MFQILKICQVCSIPNILINSKSLKTNLYEKFEMFDGALSFKQDTSNLKINYN